MNCEYSTLGCSDPRDKQNDTTAARVLSQGHGIATGQGRETVQPILKQARGKVK